MPYYIVNVGPEDWRHNLPFWPVANIKPCPAGKPYEITIIQDRRERMDIGDDRFIMQKIEAKEIAFDLSRHYTEFGVFPSASPTPKKEDLAAAKARRQAFMQDKVHEGDMFWAADRDMRSNGITDLHRRAVKECGFERDWAYTAAPQTCPYCAASVKADVAICSGCRAVLDIDKAEAGGLITSDDAARLRAIRSRKVARPTSKPTAPEQHEAVAT